jgi:hypothetical protein
MELIGSFAAGLCGADRSEIRRNRFFPITHARKNVRRHVLRVGRVWRDLGIVKCSSETFVGDRRIIVEMNQIMRDAGMHRLPLPDRLQNGGALELVGVGLVGG